ncbi:MAG: TerC family protein [Saprospiraceae bacterium]
MMLWIYFSIFIVACLAIDLGVFNKNTKQVSNKSAARWSAIWVSLALLFSLVIYWIYARGFDTGTTKTSQPFQAMIEYLTGYIVELSLSVDNIFVIAMIFRSFKIPLKYQHRVLFWGILGAIIFRALMILFGVVIIEKFSWATYVFGGFLIITAIKMAFSDEDEKEFDPKKSWVYKSLRKIIPVTGRVHNEMFIIKRNGMYIATPLLLALVLIEFTDILFAMDSIPAILSITRDPFLVFTSNIFAILGLRSMYFFIANMLDSFHYLKYGLVVILIYVGIKLILSNHYHLSLGLSLFIILSSILVSIFFSRRYAQTHGASVNETNNT